MSRPIDTFTEYTKMRMEAWGWEFSLSREQAYVGGTTKNLLQVLIEHKGEMPGRVQGYKPLQVCTQALQIESIVTEISKEDVRTAAVLRAYYCGRGRRKVERFETALLLVASVEKARGQSRPLPSLRTYQAMAADGTHQVREKLLGYARSAA